MTNPGTLGSAMKSQSACGVWTDKRPGTAGVPGAAAGGGDADCGRRPASRAPEERARCDGGGATGVERPSDGTLRRGVTTAQTDRDVNGKTPGACIVRGERTSGIGNWLCNILRCMAGEWTRLDLHGDITP